VIVDSQVHIWGADTPARPWPYPDKVPHKPVPFTMRDALREMDAAGVDAAIVVPPWWEGERNDLALQAVRAHPSRFAAMGMFDAMAPTARATLAAWRREPGMLGFRFSAQDPKYRTVLDDGRLEWVWAESERLGIPVMMSVLPSQLAAVDGIAQRHPALRIAIDHMARDMGKFDAAAFPDMDGLVALSRRPNMAVKASGMPAYTKDRYPFAAVHSYLRRAFDAFGPKRMFWGSDLTKLPCAYREAVTMFTEALPWLGAEDKRWVMGHGVCEWLGWTPDRAGATQPSAR